MPLKKSKILMVKIGLNTAVHWPPVSTLELMIKIPIHNVISPK